jgi:hypothetical protein
MLEDQTLAKKYTVRVAIFGAAFFAFFAAFYILGALRDPAIPVWTLDTLATLSFSAYGSLVFGSLITFLSLRALKRRFDLALKTCVLGGLFAAIAGGIWSSSVTDVESPFGVLINAALSFVLATAVSFVFVFVATRLAWLVLPSSKR